LAKHQRNDSDRRMCHCCGRYERKEEVEKVNNSEFMVWQNDHVNKETC
jgi:hypothetical protein